jgi:Family of unknown function (DUF6171)
MSEKLTPWQKYKENLGETRPWDVVNPNTEWADEEKAKERYSICRSCPELVKLTKQCKKCGCLMHLKTKLQGAVCPLGKW